MKNQENLSPEVVKSFAAMSADVAKALAVALDSLEQLKQHAAILPSLDSKETQ